MKTLAAWGIVSILLTGCMTPLPELSYEQWSERILDQERSTHQAIPLPDPTQQSFTFAEALQLAISASPELSSSELPLELSRIELEQAQSVVWPRFSLQGVYEVPLEEDGAENRFDGGLRIDYDLTKALFKRDFMTAAALQRQQALIEQGVILQSLKTRLQERILEKQILQEKITVIDSTLSLLQQEQKAIQSVARIKGLQVGGDWPLDEKAFAFQRMKRHSSSHLQKITRELRQMLGLDLEGPIEFVDADLLLSGLTQQYAQPLPHSEYLERVLQQHPEVKRAVLEIMASVLNLRKAEMEGLPRVGLSLGYGDYALRQSEEDAGLVGFINLSVPLFDFGDNERKQEIARIKEQMARKKLRSVALQTGAQLQTTVDEVNSAQSELEQTQAWHAKSRQRLTEIEKLYREKRINPKDRMQAVVTNARIHLDSLDAKLKWVKGLIHLATQLADDIEPSASSQ